MPSALFIARVAARLGLGTGNANVSPDAFIQPPQALVDYAAAFQSQGGIFAPAPYDAGSRITKLDVASLKIGDRNDILYAASGSGGCSVDLSLHALDQDTVDALLSAVDEANAGNPGSSFVVLSGGTNAAPSPAQENVAGSAEFTFDGSPLADGTFLDFSGSLGFVSVGVSSAVNFADSAIAQTDVYTWNMVIGTADAPSIGDIVAKIVELFNSYGLVAASAVGNVLTLGVAYDPLLPLSPTFGYGGTVTASTAGQPFMPNAAAASLAALGWTITTN